MITNNSVFFETLLAAGIFCSPTGRFDDGLTYSNQGKKVILNLPEGKREKGLHLSMREKRVKGIEMGNQTVIGGFFSCQRIRNLSLKIFVLTAKEI